MHIYGTVNYLNALITAGHEVARVRMNQVAAAAYRYCFQSIFDTVKSDYPSVCVGKSLQGIIVDWSDQQMAGLEGAVGVEKATKVAKGCRVHFTRSVKRVSERVNKGNPDAHRAFTTIAYQIPHASTEENVLVLFEVLAGEKKLSGALALCHHDSSTIERYAQKHQPAIWKPLRHWVEWWKRPRHLGK